MSKKNYEKEAIDTEAKIIDERTSRKENIKPIENTNIPTEEIKDKQKEYCGYILALGMLSFAASTFCYNMMVLKAIDGPLVPLIMQILGSSGQIFTGIFEFIRGNNTNGINFLVFGIYWFCNFYLNLFIKWEYFPEPSSKDYGWYNMVWFFVFLTLQLTAFSGGYLCGASYTCTIICTLIYAISYFCDSNTGCKVGAVFGVLASLIAYYSGTAGYLNLVYKNIHLPLP